MPRSVSRVRRCDGLWLDGSRGKAANDGLLGVALGGDHLLDPRRRLRQVMHLVKTATAHTPRDTAARAHVCSSHVSRQILGSRCLDPRMSRGRRA